MNLIHFFSRREMIIENTEHKTLLLPVLNSEAVFVIWEPDDLHHNPMFAATTANAGPPKILEIL